MKVTKFSRKFTSPSDAEEHYFQTQEVSMSTEPLSCDAFTQTEVLMESIGVQTDEPMEVQIDECNQLAPIEQLSLREISGSFQKLARTYQVCIEEDFCNWFCNPVNICRNMVGPMFWMVLPDQLEGCGQMEVTRDYQCQECQWD